MGREIVTKGARFYCVSLQPDICKTPIGPATPPIPYTVKGEFADASGVSRDIRSNDEPVVIHASTVIPTVSGDEQGTAKGVKSGTVSKRVQHDQRSSTVRFNGERAIRVGDTVFMNDKNTIGKIYKREGAGGHVAVSAQRDATTAREKPGHAVSTSDTKNSFAQRFQDLLSFVKSAKSEIVALDGNVRNAPVSLLTDAFKKTPSLASAVGGEAIKNAVQDIAGRGMKSLASEFPIFQKTLGKTPAFISSAILNRIPGVPRTAVQSASALHAEGGRPGPSQGKETIPLSGQLLPNSNSGFSDGGTSRGRARSVAPSQTTPEPAQPADEVRDKNGRLVPKGIAEAGEVNYRMWNNKNIVYNRSGNGESLEISGYVEDRGTGQGTAAVAAFNRAFTTTVQHDGRTLSIKTDMKLAKEPKQIADAAFVLKPCSDCEFADSYYVGGRASVGGFPNHVIWLSSRATAVTYGHEFGHILGLPHWHPYKSSIMAYDGIRKAGRVDVLRLFEIYRDPDAYWRRRQRRH